MMYLALFLASIISGTTLSAQQKRAYVPAYIRDTTTVEGRQFTWSKTAQSKNFLMIWGDSVGTDPSKFPNPDLRFHPMQILDTMEVIYKRCMEMGMINTDPSSKANLYKYVIVMYNTYGKGGPEGWANGWAVDDSIGAFWVHPGATRDGGVVAHEFTHSLQAMFHIDNQNPQRGNKAIYDNDGLFYETHANFVRNAIYPQAVTSDIDAHHYLMLEPDWKFNYEGYHFLFHIHSTKGLDMVSRLWTEWKPLEYPLQTLRRLTKMTQSEFNDYMFDYARNAVTWNYPMKSWGSYLRNSRRDRLNADWGRIFAQRTYDVLRAIDTNQRRYYSDPYNAPQDYGYNVVPLYVDDRTKPVVVKFIGHTEVNDHAGWRYGFVTERADGTENRRGTLHADPRKTIDITLTQDDAKLYLVVLGAPTDSMHANPAVNNTWNGNPKRYHYPYEVRLTNALPEGYQDPELVRPQLRRAPGKRHPNGGGWIDDRSKVDASVYVGPRAIVAGASTITGNARIDGHAYVQDANISGNARVTDNAFVLGGTLSDSAVIKDQCFAQNNRIGGKALLGGCSQVLNYKLGGTVRIFGDLVVYNETGECYTGEYHVLTQYYRNELLPCDNRDSTHPENVSVNRPLVFETTSVNEQELPHTGNITVAPQPAVDGTVTVQLGAELTDVTYISLVDVQGSTVLIVPVQTNSAAQFTLDVSGLARGRYAVLATTSNGTHRGTSSVIIQ